MKPKLLDPKARLLAPRLRPLMWNSNSIELKFLKQQVESLATIMKGAMVGNIKPKMGSGAPSPRRKEVSSNSP